MDHNRIFGYLLDIGMEMIKCGAETHRAEDSMYRLFAAYGFSEPNCWVIPSNIQATVTAPSGEVLTQVRHVRGAGVDFDKLDRLNSLSRLCCAEKPDSGELEMLLKATLAARPQRRLISYLGAVLAGTGFGVFFNCDVLDTVTVFFASLLIAVLGRSLRRRESNPLIVNFIIAFVAELFIMLMVLIGVGHHTGNITIGVVMLLISALGTTNGVRDLVHLDTLSGVMNISASVTGATGIALGIALPIILFPMLASGVVIGSAVGVTVGVISATVGCIGFALYFNITNLKHLATCAVGTSLTWSVYLGFEELFSGSIFMPVLIGAAFCAFFAQITSRLNKAPATIFQTICIFPLIPGSSLYYMMYGFVTGDNALGRERAVVLLVTCVALVLGFMMIEAISRFIKKAP